MRRFLFRAIALAATAATASAQIDFPDSDLPVRRALPVTEEPAPQPTVRPVEPFLRPEPPTPPAVPFDADTPAPAASPVPTTPASLAETQLQIADGYYSRKQYDLAAPEYEKYLGQYLDSEGRASALFRLGESYRQLGNRNSARNAYKSLLLNYTSGPFVAPGSYRLADIYFADGNYSQALALFERAAAKTDDPAISNAAKFYAARSLESLRRFTEARSKFESLIKVEGKNPYRDAARLALAKLLLDARRNEDAVEQFEALSKEAEKPELRAEATVRTALLKIDLDKMDAAAEDLKRALKMPGLAEWKEVAQLGLVRILYQRGKYEETIEAFKSQADTASDTAKPELLIFAANAYRKLGKQVEAQGLYERIANEFPASKFAEEARYSRVVSLYNANDPGLAAAVDEYLASDPPPEQKAQAQLLKAESLFRAKDYSAAAPAYEAVNRRDLPAEMRPEALFRQAWSLSETGEADSAATVFNTFIEEYPDHSLAATAVAQRALMRQRQKDFKAALADFNILLEKYPKAKEREIALQQKALILGQLQENKAMSQTFEQLLKEFPESPAAAQANYWIGWAEFEAKSYREAVAALDKARQLDKEEFYERASLRIILALFYLGDRDATAKNVDAFMAAETGGKIPAEILRWLGEQYFKAKNFEATVRYLDPLTEREEDRQRDDWLMLGRAHLELDDYQKARTALRNYLETAAEPVPRAEGFLALAEAEIGSKNLDSAEAAVNEALALQPEGRLNARGRMLTGDILSARGKGEAAAKTYLGLAVIFEDPILTPQALYKAYQQFKKLEQDEEAAKTLNDLKTRYPEYSQSLGL